MHLVSEQQPYNLPLVDENDPRVPEAVNSIQARQQAIQSRQRRSALISLVLIVAGSLTLAVSAGFLLGSGWVSAGILGLIILIVGVLMGLGN